ncbi:MAG: aspartate aminotransferase [Pseudomonadota bacterium]
MDMRPVSLSPEAWLCDLFGSKAVSGGAVIRRKRRDVERFAGMELFMREIERRGFQVAENGGQLIIFCNQAPVTWLTPPRVSGSGEANAEPRAAFFKESGPKSF